MKHNQNWLKTLREKRGLTQEEFTAQLQLAGCDYSRSAVSSWETDRHPVPLQDINLRRAISAILKTESKSILSLAGYEVIPSSHSDEGERVAYLVDNLPPDKRALAVRLVEQLVEN